MNFWNSLIRKEAPSPGLSHKAAWDRAGATFQITFSELQNPLTVIYSKVFNTT